MFDDLETKAVLKQTILTGSSQPDLLQLVAVVYIDGDEYRVYAPPEAKGNAIEWYAHFSVRHLDAEAKNSLQGILALKYVQEALQNATSADLRSTGLHPDGKHCAAQICTNGHVLHCDGNSFEARAHCTKCGSECIDQCGKCKEPIRGAEKFKSADSYSRPSYCHSCGRPYPWMEERLETALRLLRQDEKLTMADRKELFEDLKLVMSDPNHSLAPAKKKLINIRLEKATEVVREAILDLIAKTAAEVIKN